MNHDEIIKDKKGNNTLYYISKYNIIKYNNKNILNCYF